MKAKRIKTVGIILAALFVIEICFDPISLISLKKQNERAEKNLPIAIKKWHSSGIEDYSIDVEGGIAMVCLYSNRITVRDGILYNVEVRQDLFDNTSPFITVPVEEWNSFCRYNELTIPSIFDKIEKALNNHNNMAKIIVSFNDSYGYVTEFIYQCNVRNGILDPKLSDCGFGFHFSNFRVINNID